MNVILILQAFQMIAYIFNGISNPIHTGSAQAVIMIKRLVLISVALLVVFIVSAYTMQPNLPESITIDGITRTSTLFLAADHHI